MDTITYFAYGSNMSKKRLQNRVSSAKAIGRGVLRCHCLEFHKVSKDKCGNRSGKCDIPSASESDVVWGRLYHVKAEQMTILDCYEGLGKGYEKKCVTVELDSGCTVCAITYYVKDPTRTNRNVKPYTWYKKHVLVGAKEASLPPDYINRIKTAEAIEDPCETRMTEELRIHC